MLSKSIKKVIIESDRRFRNGKGKYKMPSYSPNNHYKHLCNSNYYCALIVLRHYIRVASDYYFSTKQKAKNIVLPPFL